MSCSLTIFLLIAAPLLSSVLHPSSCGGETVDVRPSWQYSPPQELPLTLAGKADVATQLIFSSRLYL